MSETVCVCRDDAIRVGEWWHADRDGMIVKWSPVQLWIVMGGESLVIADKPTYGDIRRLLSGLKIDEPEIWKR